MEKTLNADTILRKIRECESEVKINWHIDLKIRELVDCLGFYCRNAELAIYLYYCAIRNKTDITEMLLRQQQELMVLFLKDKDQFYRNYANNKEHKSEIIDKIIIMRELLLDEIKFDEWRTKPIEEMTDDQLIYTIYKLTYDFDSVYLDNSKEIRMQRILFLQRFRH